jgi:5-formyltetrahydrofolate cyclo-ligase
MAHLLTAVDLRAYPVLGFYWPIRDELDVRDLARRHVAGGLTAALPVVVTKNAPLEFWRWQPGASLRRGHWNIPVPLERHAVVPDALLIPLVGYDEAGLDSIRPQPHDIPLDLVVSERRVLRFARG